MMISTIDTAALSVSLNEAVNQRSASSLIRAYLQASKRKNNK